MSLRNSMKWTVLIAFAALVAVGGVVAWRGMHGTEAAQLFASGNGRIEATEINLATTLGGRLMEVLVDEGDSVAKDQVLAHMDVKTLKTLREQAEAAVVEAEHARVSALAQVTQRRDDIAAAQAQVALTTSALELSAKEFKRKEKLLEQGVVAVETLDVARNAKQADQAQLAQARSALAAARSALAAAQARVSQAEAGIEAARAKVRTIATNIDESTLTAPMDCRVLYRLAEPGEVLAPGGAVLTLLDLQSVYMAIFLPTAQAGLVDLGAEARIVLDVRPDISIPARVVYVSPQAQFTPKSVETQSEREKLMFRVKVRVDPTLLRAYADKVKTGLPGVATVRLDADAPWPAALPPVVGQARTAQ